MISGIIRVNSQCIEIRISDDRYAGFTLDEAVRMHYDLGIIIPELRAKLKKEKEAQIKRLQEELQRLE